MSHPNNDSWSANRARKAAANYLANMLTSSLDIDQIEKVAIAQKEFDDARNAYQGVLSETAQQVLQKLRR